MSTDAGTLIADILTQFPDGAIRLRATNYDGNEHGIVTMRTALATASTSPPSRRWSRRRCRLPGAEQLWV